MLTCTYVMTEKTKIEVARSLDKQYYTVRFDDLSIVDVPECIATYIAEEYGLEIG